MSRLPHATHAMAVMLLAATVAVGALATCSNPPASGPTPDSDVQDTIDDQQFDQDLADDPSDPTDTDRDRGSDPDVVEEVTPDIPVEDIADTATDTPVEDPLRIVAISPERGPSSGGTEILIVGLGFSFDSDVFLGGALCENIDVVDDTKIICETPPNPGGSYDVKVTNDLGIASLAGGFTYFESVVLSSIEPNRGPIHGGMPATVTGRGFTDGTQVSISGRVALGIEVLDAQTIRLITPPGPPGFSRVQISNESGLSALEDGFEYYAPITIERILPGAGLASGGETVIIEGVGFTDGDDLDVSFGMLDADFDVLSSTEIEVTTPPGPANDFVDVTVSSTLNGQFTAADSFFYYDDATGMRLLNVSPRQGSAAGGDVVVLSGTNLGTVTTALFGGVGVTPDTVTNSYIIAETPPHAVGTVSVGVTDGSLGDSLTDAFTYLPALLIDNISPNSGDISGGTSVTITGTGFASGATVRVGALPAGDVDVVSATEISAVTPPGAVGPADVEVRSVDGVTGSLARGFTYTAEVQVLGISPTKGSMSGGTAVVIRGAGFVEPLSLTFDGVAATNLQILDSATLLANTPPHEPGFVDVAVSIGGGDPVNALDRFLYFDPVSSTGGHWGEDILGAVNVTVLSDNGAPLLDAFVQLDVRAEAQYFGYTDANGQVTLSGPDLSGEQTVSASRVGFSSSTVQAVNAENITVILSCVPANQCFSPSDCDTGFVCTCGPPFNPMGGVCLEENYCGFEPQSLEEFEAACVPDFPPVPYAVITGNLTGVHKVDDPGPGELIQAWVFTTQPHPLQASSPSAGSENELYDDGPFTLRSRVGEIALVAVCGIFNTRTDTFHPRYMGVQRGLFMVDGETYDIDLDCNIRLDQTLTVKAVSPPLTPDGPDTFIHTPYLHFGSEGYFGGIVTLEGDDDVLSAGGFAPLEGELAGLDYYILGGAFTGTSFPESLTFLEGVTAIDDVITLPEFLSAPHPVSPRERDGWILLDRYIEWEMETDVQPDFYSLIIYDFNDTTYWDVLVPGDQTSVNLPYFADPDGVGFFASGTLILQILAVDVKIFDYDDFDNYTNFSLSNWNGYSVNAFLFNNPG